MKKLFILSLATLGFVACQKKGEHIILSGKIANYDNSPVQLVGGNDIQKDLKINPDGSFVDTLDVKPNYYFLFNEAGLYVPLYLQKGDNVVVDIDLAQNPVSVKFTGENAAVGNYLSEKRQLTKDLQQGFMAVFQKDFEGFKTEIEGIDKKYADLLANAKGLPKEFVALEKKSNNYLNLQLKSIYPQAHSRFANAGADTSKDFSDELAKVDYDNADDFEMFPEYKQLVTENFYSKFDRKNIDWNALINHVRGLKSENIKTYLAQAFVDGLAAGNTPETNTTLLNAAKEFVKDEKIIKRAETRFQSFEKLKPGNPSPTFDFENFAGGKTSLESLKGNLVYIDVWATWCVPCLNEVPALQALEKEFHGKKVSFVSISIDQDKNKWIDYQKANKPTGIQLYGDLSVQDNFADRYDIQTIPRFILIDKEGNIINADAPRPSDPEIKELINKNL